jgi:hypothetical protein
MEHVSFEHSVEIILTPEFYTLISEELDIRFAYQAKQIAESLFDDYLDASREYQYHVTKHEDAWYFYAYNIKEIEEFIESIGIEKHRVSKIYFAQELSSQLEEPIQLSDKHILQTIENTVTLIPLRLMDSNANFNSLNLEEIKLSSGVSMGASHNSLVSLKETILLGSIFFILGTIFIFEGSRIKASISNDEDQLIALIDDNPSYGSTMLRENILEKYQPIDQNERAKRQSIKDISKLLSAKSELTSLSIIKSKIIVNIKTSDDNIAKQVVQNAKAKNFKSSTAGQTVKVEKSL